MRDMRKITAMFVMLGVLLTGNTVLAGQLGNVYDDAGLLSDSEMTAVDEKITSIAEQTGWNVYAVTTADAEGKSATAYADDFFDAHSPEQEDGVAVLIDMDNREITISTCGEAIRYLTDDRIEGILDDAYYDVSDGAYGDCLMTMLNGVDNAYDAGIPSGQYNYDVETGEVSVYHSITLVEALIAVGLAVATGVIIYVVVVGRYQLKFGTYQYDFRDNSNVFLRENEDRFVHETTTHRRIPKQTSSGGGGSSSGRSSTHRSSSGRSHGGGSRKF